LPITGSVDEQVKQTMERLLDQWEPGTPRPVLVLEFWPASKESGEGSQFERSLSLARFLTSERLSRARTVAFLPRSIKGHAVLVAMACEEIVMHPDAEFGEAGIGETAVDPTVRSGYREIADRSRTMPAAVALGMLDRRLEVYKVQVAGGSKYVLEDQLEELRGTTVVKSIETIIPADELGSFTGRDLRLKYGFVSQLASDRNELASQLRLPAEVLEDDPSLGGRWLPIQAELKGPTSGRAAARVQRIIEDRLRGGGVNFVCLWLESAGGSPQNSMNLANFLADLDSSQIRTVAYVPFEARADAALIAFACDHIVMRENAVLGGPGAYQMDADEIQDVRESIHSELALKKSRSWSLLAAMLDPNMKVHHYTIKGGNWSGFFGEKELAAQSDPDRWVQGQLETTPGEPYHANGIRAQQVGLAKSVVVGFEEFKQLYHLEDDPALIQPGWAEELIHALGSPELASVLLFVGAFALFVELSSLGVGIGGFVALVCYMLFFWSQFLQGTAGWLEVLLFFAGASCVVLDIFVIPGFGIFGLGGGALVILSLVLASQTFVQIPRNEYQFTELRHSLLMVGAALGGVFAGLIMLRRYAHRAPLVRRVMLVPPMGEQLEELSRRESIVDWSHLHDQRGVTTTQLTPAGKAQFGDQLVNVVSDGQLVPSGTEVRVMEVYGNRVVVKPN